MTTSTQQQQSAVDEIVGAFAEVRGKLLRLKDAVYALPPKVAKAMLAAYNHGDKYALLTAGPFARAYATIHGGVPASAMFLRTLRMDDLLKTAAQEAGMKYVLPSSTVWIAQLFDLTLDQVRAIDDAFDSHKAEPTTGIIPRGVLYALLKKRAAEEKKPEPQAVVVEVDLTVTTTNPVNGEKYIIADEQDTITFVKPVI